MGTQLDENAHGLGLLSMLAGDVAAVLEELRYDAHPANVYRNAALGGGAVDIVAAIPARAYWWYVYNPGLADVFAHLYDEPDALEAQGSAGTAPILSLWIPAGGGEEQTLPGRGLGFRRGIAIGVTTTLTGSAAPATAVLAQVGHSS